MSTDELSNNRMETPLEAAARSESRTPRANAELEAVSLVADIDSFVANTDPEHLADAAAELDAWETPHDPLDEADVDLDANGSLVSVFSAYNEVEANIVKGVLDSAGIPCDFDSHGGSVMGGIFSSGEEVWAEILVPERYADAARTVIADAASDSEEVQADDATESMSGASST